jgi:hypothetical protein
LIAASSATAHAGDPAQAALLAREAEDLVGQGKFAEACPKLAQSYELDPRGGTMLDLAVCHEKEGKIATAHREYGVAAEMAKAEKRQDRLNTARNRRAALNFKLPKATIKPDAKALEQGLSVTLDGKEIPASEWNKPFPVDPGKRTFRASAPGRKSWEKTITFAKSQRQKVIVPALVAGKDDKPPPPVAKPGPAAVKPKEEPKPKTAEDEPNEEPEEEPEPSGSDKPPEHESGRLIVEASFLGGYLWADVSRGALSELRGTNYVYQSNSGGEFIASCGTTDVVPGAGECEATFRGEHGGLIGGHLFVGYAITDFIHLGARGMMAKRFPDGFMVLGGPALSINVAGPVWLGATFVLGTEEHTAQLESAEGSVPPDQQAVNGGDQVTIPLSDLAFTDGTVGAGFVFGGSLELGLEIVGPSANALVPTSSPTDFLNGAVMLSLWPTFVKASDGIGFAAPAGLGYKFH